MSPTSKDSSGIIASRTTGEQFPLSIPTELAIAALLGTHPDKPVQVAPIDGYNNLWINIRTLYRNLVSSVPSGDQDAIDGDGVAMALFEEMGIIDSLIREQNPRCQVHFYVSEYRNLKEHYPYAEIRALTTPKQISQHKIQQASLRELITSLEGGAIKVFERELKPATKSKAIILTNYAYDLLWHKSFGELDLIESHTGTIKKKNQFYTKYYNGKELPMIPFTQGLLQVFGDNELFKPFPSKARKLLVDVAVQNRWTQLTTLDKIRANIKMMTDLYFKDLLLKIIH